MLNSHPNAVQLSLAQPVYMNTEQLAAAIPASRRTIDYWRAGGVIPYVKVGRVIRFDLQAVKAALEKRFMVKATDKPYRVRPIKAKARRQ